MGDGIYCWLTFVISVSIVYGRSVPFDFCDKPADIALLIDSSSSIEKDDFKKQIEFVQDLVSVFNVRPDTVQVAALTFSQNVVKEFHFNEVASAEEASARIGKIEHEVGLATLTHNALEVLQTDIFSPSNGARANVTKICILLTDGRPTNPRETLKQADLAKAAGITILAVGIGNKVNEKELKAVVSPPVNQNYFHSSTFDNLKETLLKELIGQSACDAIETTTSSPVITTDMQGDKDPDEECEGKNADILFVVDMSNSVYGEDFKKQLAFLADLVSKFDINSGKTRVGMLTFSNNTEMQFHIDTFRSQDNIRGSILKVVSKGGWTNTHLALRKARYELFNSERGSQVDVAHICIVITDGVSRLPKMTEEESNMNRQAGMDVFAIGVGDDVDVKELHAIASRPDYVFEVNGYDALKQIENILAVKTCEGDDETVCRGRKLDIVFVVDMSNSIWKTHFNEQLTFLSDLIGFFDISSDTTRVGFMTFSTNPAVQFYLNTYSTRDEVSKAILAVQTIGGLTNTHLALQKAQNEMLTPNRGSRSDVEQVIVVITDGESREPRQTATEAENLHQAGVEVIAIGVGDKVNKGELVEMASRPENVFEVSNSNNLQRIRNILARTTCEVVHYK